ncbi:hypothetical protein EDB95_1960 [Dinghuibacter silviterrae]|uniref:Uncharacterized protein n=1 Tax=Dinghuibacter silviterrae TaxID=1539049 RepID=A0A4R8DRT6_9BACT|nr:hypothetical protein EDB95_1960 [Dinghuibacter silviterrae]
MHPISYGGGPGNRALLLFRGDMRSYTHKL